MAGVKDKVVLVTGGTSGIGKAAAIALAKAGSHVAITGRREKEGEAVAEQVRKHGVKGLYIRGDVSSEADNRRFVEQALTLTGRLDGAFNNAGIEGDVGKMTHEQTQENWKRVFEINVLGVLLSMKHQIPAMLRTGGGAIVNNASVAGSVGLPGASTYVASKHAVLGLTRCAALEYAKQGVRVNAVSPAAIYSEMFDRFTGGPESEFAAQLAAMHPVGRIGTPEEVAAAVVFMLSAEASFITGHDFRVDGALTAQ